MRATSCLNVARKVLSKFKTKISNGRLLTWNIWRFLYRIVMCGIRIICICIVAVAGIVAVLVA